MTAELIVGKLDGVRRRGVDQWSARCPAHEDRGPSLSVKSLPDGRVLLHCFAGCEVADVLGALGLDMTDLFPPKTEPGGGATVLQRRRLLPPGQALDILADEAQLVAVSACNVASGVELTDADRGRLVLAAARITALCTEVAS